MRVNRTIDGAIKNPQFCGIYKITCLINDKKIIGQTVDFRARKRSHSLALRKGIHGNLLLQRAYNKYGEDNFEFSVIETCSDEQLNDREIFWINSLRTKERDYGYNILPGGSAMKTYLHSDELRAKLSASRLAAGIKGSKCYQYGKKMPPEFGAAISAAKRANPLEGENHPHYGMKRSEQTKRNMRDAQRKSEKFKALRQRLAQQKRLRLEKKALEKQNRIPYKKPSKKVCQMDENEQIINIFDSALLASVFVGVARSAITKACADIKRTSAKCKWRYLGDI
jgi:group I intron endonuclease